MGAGAPRLEQRTADTNAEPPVLSMKVSSTLRGWIPCSACRPWHTLRLPPNEPGCVVSCAAAGSIDELHLRRSGVLLDARNGRERSAHLGNPRVPLSVKPVSLSNPLGSEGRKP